MQEAQDGGFPTAPRSVDPDGHRVQRRWLKGSEDGVDDRGEAEKINRRRIVVPQLQFTHQVPPGRPIRGLTLRLVGRPAPSNATSEAIQLIGCALDVSVQIMHQPAHQGHVDLNNAAVVSDPLMSPSSGPLHCAARRARGPAGKVSGRQRGSRMAAAPGKPGGPESPRRRYLTVPLADRTIPDLGLHPICLPWETDLPNRG